MYSRVLLGYFQTKQGPFACVRLDVRKLMDLDPISSFQKLSRCYLWQEGLPPSLPPPLKVAPSSPSSLHINALGVRARPSSHVSRLGRCVRFDRAPTDIHLNVRFFEVIFHFLLAVFLSSSSCLRKKEWKFLSHALLRIHSSQYSKNPISSHVSSYSLMITIMMCMVRAVYSRLFWSLPLLLVRWRQEGSFISRVCI